MLATSANDPTLRRQLLALSPAVRPDEAERVAHCAYTTGRELAREWRVVWIPGVQNFLVNIGARKGGLCFSMGQRTFESIGCAKAANTGSSLGRIVCGNIGRTQCDRRDREGTTFEKGILLDNWRYGGHLVYGRVSNGSRVQMDERIRRSLPRRLKANSTPTQSPACNRRDETIDAALPFRLQCAITNRETSNAAGTPPSPQPGTPQTRQHPAPEHCGRQRHDVVDGISKNVIWVSRVEAVEMFERLLATRLNLLSPIRVRCSLGW